MQGRKTETLLDLCSVCSAVLPQDEVLVHLKKTLYTQAKATVSISRNPFINQGACKRIQC